MDMYMYKYGVPSTYGDLSVTSRGTINLDKYAVTRSVLKFNFGLILSKKRKIHLWALDGHTARNTDKYSPESDGPTDSMVRESQPIWVHYTPEESPARAPCQGSQFPMRPAPRGWRLVHATLRSVDLYTPFARPVPSPAVSLARSPFPTSPLVAAAPAS